VAYSVIGEQEVKRITLGVLVVCLENMLAPVRYIKLMVVCLLDMCLERHILVDRGRV